MKDFFKKHFIDFGDGESTQEKSQVPQTTPIQAGAVPSITPSGLVQSSIGTVDAKMLEMLEQAIAESNLTGFDYFEFSQAVNSEDLKVLPEHQRFKAAFTIAKSLNVTVDGLVSSVNHYQKVITDKKTAFETRVKEKTAEEITSRETRKTKNDQDILQAQEQIKALQAKVNELSENNILLSTEIHQEGLKIQSASSSFATTFNSVYQKLEDDKLKIKTYLGS